MLLKNFENIIIVLRCVPFLLLCCYYVRTYVCGDLILMYLLFVLYYQYCKRSFYISLVDIIMDM